MPLHSRPARCRWVTAGGLCSALLASLSWGGDPASAQIERARVLREMAETSVAAAIGPRPVLAPARLEAEQLRVRQNRALANDNEVRWRRLLGEQARSSNLPSDEPGAVQIRSLVDGRLQETQNLHRRIQWQDMEHRLKRDR